MITLREQQEIAANILKQPVDDVVSVGFVDVNTNIFCVVSAIENNKLLTREQLKGYKGGFVLLVGPDGGTLMSGSAFSCEQLIKKYLDGVRSGK